jgi:hypothetical protein
MLDIGCGSDTWLRAAIDLGIGRVLGIDWVDVAQELLHLERAQIEHLDFAVVHYLAAFPSFCVKPLPRVRF